MSALLLWLLHILLFGRGLRVPEALQGTELSRACQHLESSLHSPARGSTASLRDVYANAVSRNVAHLQAGASAESQLAAQPHADYMTALCLL